MPFGYQASVWQRKGRAMGRRDVCGNDYEKTIVITMPERAYE